MLILIWANLRLHNMQEYAKQITKAWFKERNAQAKPRTVFNTISKNKQTNTCTARVICYGAKRSFTSAIHTFHQTVQLALRSEFCQFHTLAQCKGLVPHGDQLTKVLFFTFINLGCVQSIVSFLKYLTCVIRTNYTCNNLFSLSTDWAKTRTEKHSIARVLFTLKQNSEGVPATKDSNCLYPSIGIISQLRLGIIFVVD